MNGRNQSIAVASLGCAVLASLAVTGVCAVNRVDIPAYIVLVGTNALTALATYIIPQWIKNGGINGGKP